LTRSAWDWAIRKTP